MIKSDEYLETEVGIFFFRGWEVACIHTCPIHTDYYVSKPNHVCKMHADSTKRAREVALFVATGASNVTVWLTRHMVCRIVALGVRGLSCPIVVLPSYRLPLSITIYNQQQVPALAPHWLTDRQWIGGRTGPFKKKKIIVTDMEKKLKLKGLNCSQSY